MSAEPTPLPDVLAAVTLGPEDRLILAYPRGSFGYAEAEYMDSFLRERGLSGRVVLANGVEDVIVLRATKAEGSTVGQCGDRLPPLFGAREYAPGESVQSCHLAYGHTGMHSDGTATWATPEPVQLQPPAKTAHGYTSHGHPCCGDAVVGERPRVVARCGGAAVCKVCAVDAGRVHGGTDTNA